MLNLMSFFWNHAVPFKRRNVAVTQISVITCQPLSQMEHGAGDITTCHM